MFRVRIGCALIQGNASSSPKRSVNTESLKIDGTKGHQCTRMVTSGCKVRTAAAASCSPPDYVATAPRGLMQPQLELNRHTFEHSTQRPAQTLIRPTSRHGKITAKQASAGTCCPIHLQASPQLPACGVRTPTADGTPTLHLVSY